MKPANFENLLRGAEPLPPADPLVVERACHRALTAFRHAEAVEPPRTFALPKWGLAAACAALVLLLVSLGHEPGNGRTALLDEMEALFPGRVSAVLIHGRDISLVLSDHPVERPADQRLEIPLPGGLVVLAYSGVDVSAGGREITPLLTGDGSVFAVDESGQLFGGHRL